MTVIAVPREIAKTNSQEPTPCCHAQERHLFGVLQPISDVEDRMAMDGMHKFTRA
jgi:hypothetical protein